jgi:hypothetical protein
MSCRACAPDPSLSGVPKKTALRPFLLSNEKLLAQCPRGLESLFPHQQRHGEDASSAGASSGGAWVCLIKICADQMPIS